MGRVSEGRVGSNLRQRSPGKGSATSQRIGLVLVYLLYIIQRQGKSSPKKVLRNVMSEIYFFRSSTGLLDFPTKTNGFF